ncbi:hypothetical protein [Streptomyces sp. NPDC048419]|uniref:hypothetical protein n=1 Tax=Streptomyces sp. NPDC048419 TaxID=3365547 RepID=UPI00371DC7DD
MDPSASAASLRLLRDYLDGGHIPAGLIQAAQDVVRQEPAGALPPPERAAFWIVKALVAEGWHATDFARPLTYAARWAETPVLHSGYPQFVYQIDAALEALDTPARKRGAVDNAAEEVEEFGSYLVGLLEACRSMGEDWPGLWSFRRSVPVVPGLFADLLELGLDSLSAASAGLLGLDVQQAGDLTVQEVWSRQANLRRRYEMQPAFTLRETESVARALTSGEWRAEDFAAPLDSLHHWADSRAAETGVPEFHHAVVQMLQARAARGDTRFVHVSYIEALASLKALFARMARGLGVVAEGWPTEWAVKGRVPAVAPRSVMAMIDTGMAALTREAESGGGRQEAEETRPESTRDGQQFPYGPAAEGKPHSAAAGFPRWENVEAFVRALAVDGWVIDHLADPLAHLDKWAGSSVLHKGYQDYANLVVQYLNAPSPGAAGSLRPKEVQRHAHTLRALCECLQVICDVIGEMGAGWPQDWWSENSPEPAEPPEVVHCVLSAGLRKAWQEHDRWIQLAASS